VAEAFLHNPLQKHFADHIDNNKINNNVNNLRWCTNQENCFNAGLSKANSSGTKGVTFDKKFKQWRAQIVINGKCKYLGKYDKKEDAIKARVNIAKELFGEFINSIETIKEEIKEIKTDKKIELDELLAL
jgi:hypothetical protein